MNWIHLYWIVSTQRLMGSLIGLKLFMVLLRKSYQMIFHILWAKLVTTTTTVDANLNHCLATGRSLTGCLHFMNHSPIDSYSKRQATVETATYGSEFVASKTATEHIIDLRHTLRYLGVPINQNLILFGDSRSVVTCSTLPHSTLGKRHHLLAYH